MPHQTLSTRNDYEQKINYDWPKLHFPQKISPKFISLFEDMNFYFFNFNCFRHFFGFALPFLSTKD